MITPQLLKKWEKYCSEIEERNRGMLEIASEYDRVAIDRFKRQIADNKKRIAEAEKKHEKALKKYNSLKWWQKIFVLPPEINVQLPDGYWPPVPHLTTREMRNNLDKPTWEGFLTWLS